MKVLLVSHRPDYIGGIASWTKRMMMINYEDISFVLVDASPINRDAFKNTRHSVRDEAYRSLKIWHQEAKILKADKEIRVVHTNIPCTLFGQIRETVTGIICKLYGRKFVLHCHCTVPNVVKGRLSQLYFKFLLKFCDGVIVLNKQSKKFVEEFGGRKVTLIPNFIMKEELESNTERKFGSKIKNAVYVGGVTVEKGCDIIINISRKYPEITFHLVGLVSDRIKCIPHLDNVKFYGNVDSKMVNHILENADVFLFLSRFYGEGFSCALTEAMGGGLPCIVSDWAANKDMIENKGGIVLECVSEDSLCEAIEELSNAPDKREKMSEWNRYKVRTQYTDVSMKKAYLDFYCKVLD